LPCRNFNKKNKGNYGDARALGIEVIGINVDKSEKRWIKSSFQDDIKWINLYAGDDWQIRASFGVHGFHTKVVLDRNLKRVPINFESIEEFMRAIKYKSKEEDI